MKRIKFDIDHCGKKYTVYIQRELRHYFNTKREADQFVSHCKKLMIDNLAILTEISKWQYNYYAEHLTYMDSLSMSSFTEYHTDFNLCFKRIFHNSASIDNKVSVQFKQISCCFNALEDGNTVIAAYAKNNRERVLIKRISALVKMLQIVRYQYDNELKGMRFIKVQGNVRTLKIDQNDFNNVLSSTGTSDQ